MSAAPQLLSEDRGSRVAKSTRALEEFINEKGLHTRTDSSLIDAFDRTDLALLKSFVDCDNTAQFVAKQATSNLLVRVLHLAPCTAL
jgi:hypothetical protein